jgi:hypothetical protein
MLPATVVVSDGEGRTARMRVELIDTDLASADLAAVKMQVTNLGDQPDSAEALSTSGSATQQVLTRVEPGTGSITYSSSQHGDRARFSLRP